MKKFLVLGRKGSGKTAIYRRLLGKDDSTVLAEGYSFEDYPWHHHDLQAEVGVPEERRYVHSWKYLILMNLAKILLNKDNSQPWCDSSFEPIQRLEAFVVDSYGSSDPDMATLFSPDQRIKVKGSIDFKLVKVEGERVSMQDLPVHIQAVNRAMQECIVRSLNPSLKYYICFDQLDLGFSIKDPTYSQRLVGLIIAAKDIFLAARESGKNLSPTVFLRDDIFHELQFEDKNKITENYASWITWNASSTAQSALTLKRLMETRFTEVVGQPDLPVIWEDVFEEDSGSRMPGRQTKYQHICDRTFLRPRDMIKFCNEVLVHFKNGESSTDRFDNNCVHSAREGYSEYLLNEIDDEISKHVPAYREYLEIIKSIGQEKFELGTFQDIYKDRFTEPGSSAIRAIEDLFTFSIISYLKPGGRGGGSEYVWRYKDSRARFDPTVKSFRVHPGFKEALGLIR